MSARSNIFPYVNCINEWLVRFYFIWLGNWNFRESYALSILTNVHICMTIWKFAWRKWCSSKIRLSIMSYKVNILKSLNFEELCKWSGVLLCFWSCATTFKHELMSAMFELSYIVHIRKKMPKFWWNVHSCYFIRVIPTVSHFRIFSETLNNRKVNTHAQHIINSVSSLALGCVYL